MQQPAISRTLSIVNIGAGAILLSVCSRDLIVVVSVLRRCPRPAHRHWPGRVDMLLAERLLGTPCPTGYRIDSSVRTWLSPVVNYGESTPAWTFSGPARCSLPYSPHVALLPYYRELFLKCFRPFVASWPAPSTSGRSESGRAGISPTELVHLRQGTHNNWVQNRIRPRWPSGDPTGYLPDRSARGDAPQ